MTKSKIFLLLSLSFISGVWFRSFWELDIFLGYAILLVAVILLCVFWKNKKAAVAAFLLLSFLGGVWRSSIAIDKVASIEASMEASIETDGQEFNGRMIVAKEPEVKDDYQKIVAKTTDGEKVLINANKHLALAYGDEIQVECLFQLPENRDGEFDYRMYLAKDGIYRICQKTKIEKTGNDGGNLLYAALLKLKNKTDENIWRLIPGPEAALGSGVLLGGSNGLSEKAKADFSRTGLTHIVAVSGYNVTIIAEYLILLGIFLGLWRKQALVFAVVGIALFVLLVGFPASAVRAGVMGGLVIWAMRNGRLANSTNALVCAAVIMILINPLILRYDIGFQLSFLATLGIITLSPFFENWLIRKHKALGATEIISLSICAQVFVLPIIFINFQTFSVVSLLANVAVLPVVPLTMLLVFLMSAAGFVFWPLANVLAWLAFLPLKYETWIVSVLSGLEWASMDVKSFGVGAALLWYAGLIGAVVFLKRRNFYSTEYEK